MLRNHLLRVSIFAVLGLAIGLIVALVSPRVYESDIEVLVGGDNENRSAMPQLTPDVQEILSRGQNQDMETERQLISSASIFQNAVVDVANATGHSELIPEAQDLYQKYDVVSARRPTNMPTEAPGVLMLRVRAYDQDMASRIAAAIVTEYDKQKAESAASTATEAANYLASQIQDTKKDLDTSQNRLKQYKESAGIAEFAVTQRDMQTIVTTLQQNLLTLQEQKKASQAEIASLQDSIRHTPKFSADSSAETKSPVIDQVTAQIVNEEANRQALLKEYQSDAPVVQKSDDVLRLLRSRLATLKKQTMTKTQSVERINPTLLALQQNLDQAKAKLANIDASVTQSTADLAAQKTKLALLPANEEQISSISRDLDILDNRYKLLQSQFKSVELRKNIEPKALVLGDGRPMPNEVFREPNPIKFGLIGFIAGACLGLLVGFAADSLSQRVKGSLQLSELTGLPVLASLPAGRASESSLGALKSQLESRTPSSESFRYMAAALTARGADASRSFLFCNPRRSGPAALASLNFAQSLVEVGKRVLLVDIDALSGALSRILDVKEATGLIDLLSDPSAPIDPVHVAGFDVLPIGAGQATLLSAGIRSLPQVLARLTEAYDCVIFAGSPCEVLADSSSLCGHVDETVLVVSERANNALDVLRAQELLLRAGARALSLVLVDATNVEEPFSPRFRGARPEPLPPASEGATPVLK